MANRKKWPTKAQWELLERLQRAGDGGLSARTLPVTQATNMSVLISRGWVHYFSGFPNYVIDKAGVAALKARAERNGK